MRKKTLLSFPSSSFFLCFCFSTMSYSSFSSFFSFFFLSQPFPLLIFLTFLSHFCTMSYFSCFFYFFRQILWRRLKIEGGIKMFLMHYLEWWEKKGLLSCTGEGLLFIVWFVCVRIRSICSIVWKIIYFWCTV